MLTLPKEKIQHLPQPLKLNRMKIHYYLLIFLCTFFFSCQHNTEKPKLRIGNFLVGEGREEVSVQIQQKDSMVYAETLDYGSLTSYHSFQEGKYNISVIYHGKKILERTYGLGENGTYTLYFSGIATEKTTLNQTSITQQLHRIVEGQEANTPNGALARMEILNEGFQGGKNDAQIRYVHLAPLLKSIEGRAITSKKDTTALKALTYPKIMDAKSLKPGKYTFQWHLKNGPEILAKTAVNLKSKNLYTLFIIGKTADYANQLQVVVGETKSKK